MRRLLLTLFALVLLAPSTALAHDGGQGIYGKVNDKVTTNAGFIIIAAIPLFIFLMSVLQWQLDKRKHRRMDAKLARQSSPDWAGGW